jgi:hypothetical protein
MVRNFREEVEQMLEDHGGLYTFDDILDQIHSGKMQSFTDGQSWIVTAVHRFPRKTVLEVVLVVGSLDALKSMECQLLAFKEEVGAQMLMASGRLGWLKVKSDNWKAVSVNFVRT